MITTTVNTRELMRDQRTVIKRLQQTKQPVIIIGREGPQAALVSMSDLAALESLHRLEALKKLADLTAQIAASDQEHPLPKDLSTNHNQYFYEALGVHAPPEKPMTVIVDTDILIAHLISSDSNHQKAQAIYQKLICSTDKKHNLILLSSTLAEFATISTIKAGLVPTQTAIEYYLSLHTIFEMTVAMTQEAVALFRKQTSKENSLFDCYVMIAATHLQADCILSFDKGYVQNKYKLYQDLSLPS